MLGRYGIVTLFIATLLASCVDLIPNSPGSTHQLGDTLLRSTDEAAMVFVPAGEFIMGSDIEMVKPIQ